jgi:hypothetical protein
MVKNTFKYLKKDYNDNKIKTYIQFIFNTKPS